MALLLRGGQRVAGRVLSPTSKAWSSKLALAGCGATAVGAAAAIRQAFDLRTEWRGHYRLRASACQGPTEGVEPRGETQGRPLVSPASSEAAPSAAPDSGTLLLFLGDSLVSGVGGHIEGSAPLPQHVAACLAQRQGGQVRWAAVGITGAHVARLRDEGLPQLRQKVKRATERAHASKVVVVLVVGVNDLRKLNLASYRLGLRSLVSELRYIAREDKAVDAVVLPALRIADAPLLQRFPLNMFLLPICALWEREKRKAVRWLFGGVEGATVLPFPPPPRGEETISLFAADQMHPSPFGYRWWAEQLAEEIHRMLQEGHSRPKSTDDDELAFERREQLFLTPQWSPAAA